jgi:hypothetical protein
LRKISQKNKVGDKL